MKTLKEAKIGETVKVVKLNGEGAVKRRLMDMGITKGVSVYVRKVAPLGDPVEVTVRGYELSLRKYCNYFDMSLKELLEEAEEDEMKGVKWKHSMLKSKLVEYTSHVSKLCCRNRQKGNELYHLFLQVL